MFLIQSLSTINCSTYLKCKSKTNIAYCHTSLTIITNCYTINRFNFSKESQLTVEKKHFIFPTIVKNKPTR